MKYQKIIEQLRKDTIEIIDANPCCVEISKEEEVFEDGIVAGTQTKSKGFATVRFIGTDSIDDEKAKQMGSSGIVFSQNYMLLAEYDEKIEEGCFLTKKNGDVFLVKNVEKITLFDADENCFKLNCLIEKIKKY